MKLKFNGEKLDVEKQKGMLVWKPVYSVFEGCKAI
jgi:hypothetical protein